MKNINLAVVGATGMVGRTFLKILEERDFPYENLYLFASERSAGKKLTCKGKAYVVEALTENSFDRDIDIALFSAGGNISEKFLIYYKFTKQRPQKLFKDRKEALKGAFGDWSAPG